MAGFKTLNTECFSKLLAQTLSPKMAGPLSLTVAGVNLHYFYDEANKTIVLDSPLTAPYVFAKECSEHSFSEIEKALQTALSKDATELENYNIIAGLIGRGLAEQHIVALCKPAGTSEITLYDPKFSDPENFFAIKKEFKFSNFLNVLKGIFFFSPAKITIEAEEKGSLIPLGTQSTLDGISCGHKSIEIINTMVSLLQNKKPINRETILSNDNNVIDAGISFLQMDPKLKEKVESDFSDFIKKAWFDTFLPFAQEEERNKSVFLNYFLGWPKEKDIGKKIIYFTSLGFLTYPIVNLIKLPTEFLFNALSETASYLRNRLFVASPKNLALQYLTTAGIAALYGFQGLFKAASLIIRTVTSPITSFNVAWKIHPVLGLISGLVSASAYAALAFFAAPLVLASLGAVAAPVVASVILPALKIIAFPVSYILGQAGVALAPVISALITLVAATALVAGIKATAEKANAYFRPKVPAPLEGLSQSIEEDFSTSTFEDDFEPPEHVERATEDQSEESKILEEDPQSPQLAAIR